MATLRGIIRKWGNSLGIIIPKETVIEEGIHENDEVEVLITKIPRIQDLFGKIKLGVTAQRVKEELRREWGE
jgi:hypothetical protein